MSAALVASDQLVGCSQPNQPVTNCYRFTMAGADLWIWLPLIQSVTDCHQLNGAYVEVAAGRALL